VSFDVERGGEPLRLEVPVGDLHAITPDRYLEMGGGILHALSYQQARNRGLPVRGVYVAAPGYALGRSGVPARAVLRELGGEPIADLAAAEAILAALSDGARVPLRYVRLEEPRAPRVAVLTMDRRWFPMRSCARDDAAGTWRCREAPPPPPAPAPTPHTIDFAGNGPRCRTPRSVRSGVTRGPFEGLGLIRQHVQGPAQLTAERLVAHTVLGSEVAGAF
jgi:hypothetical protein